MNNPEILVRVDDSMPLGELLEENKDPNKSIKRSAHVGNMFGGDLILSALGMKMILVDANYGEKDKLYFPQFIVDETNPTEQVACPRTLSLANRHSDGRPLSDACIGSLADAFGNESIVSDAQFVEQYKDSATRILEVVLKYKDRPEVLPDPRKKLFTRQISSDGYPVGLTAQPKSVDDVLLYGSEPESGVITPNLVTILIDFVIESMKYQSDSITHISGPTMFVYLKSMRSQMNFLYQKLVEESGLPLPNTLQVRLVPASGVRFVIAAAQADDLLEILALQAELTDIRASVAESKKQLAGSGVRATKADFNILSKPQKSAEQELARLLSQVPQLFFVASPETNTPTFTSQHTALRNGADGTPGSGLFIPDFVLERPIAEVSAQFAELDIIRKRNI
jgi:hypothetical protein